MLKPLRFVVSFLGVALTAGVLLPAQAGNGRTLDIYFVDTEGGQATLFVSPSGQSVLVDTGNPGPRDARRITDAVKHAGLTQIDYLVVTHYHGDHIGGFLELEKLVSIKAFVDHGPGVQADQVSDSMLAYERASGSGRHLVVRAGDKVPVTGIDWTIVSSAGKVLSHAIAGAPAAGKPNPLCASYLPKQSQMNSENAMSVGSVVTFGKFRMIDLGDLLWNLEADLVCPVNRLGTVDLYLTTHHGLDLSGPPQSVHALRPRVAIMNNGTTKGGQLSTYATVESSPGLEDIWQLHWSYNGLLEHNPPALMIANVDENDQLSAVIAAAADARESSAPPAAATNATLPAGRSGNSNHSPAHWIKVSASADGSFAVFNSRNGFRKRYDTR
jgi:beta-lactamase superfamily II metal-dependent hydrolase